MQDIDTDKENADFEHARRTVEVPDAEADTIANPDGARVVLAVPAGKDPNAFFDEVVAALDHAEITSYATLQPPEITKRERVSEALLSALKDLLDQLRTIGIPEWHGAEGLSLDASNAAIARAEA